MKTIVVDKGYLTEIYVIKKFGNRPVWLYQQMQVNNCTILATHCHTIIQKDIKDQVGLM